MLTDKLISVADSQTIGNVDINYSVTEPSNPSDGDMWYEPGALYPQPWIWNASDNNWLSNTIQYFNAYQEFQNTTTLHYVAPFYGVTTPKIKLTQVSAFIAIAGTGNAHNDSNQYTFEVGSLRGDKLYYTEYSFNTDTGTNPSALGLTGWRRILEYPNHSLPGNAWTISQRITKIGNPAFMSGTFSMYLRLPRP